MGRPGSPWPQTPITKRRKQLSVAKTLTAAARDKLLARFDVEDHKTNPRGYTYIGIEKVINRLIEVDPAFEIRVTKSEFAPLPGLTYGRNSKAAGYALVAVEVTVLGVTRAGVGGDYGAADDADKLVKTAYAEAIKKAGHEFGVALYLWDEEERALIESAQSQGLTGQVAPAATPPTTVPQVIEAPATVTTGNEAGIQHLKDEVTRLALAAGVQMTAPAIAAHFGVPVEALQSPEVLQQIVSANVAAPV
jgi:hypothetical protein